MARLSPSKIADLASQAGFQGADLTRAVAVALAESTGNPNVRNTSGGNDARGLMQINVAPQANPKYKNLNLYDPATNMRVAKEMQSASGWGPWKWSSVGQAFWMPTATAVTAGRNAQTGAKDAVDSAIPGAAGLTEIGQATSKVGKWVTTPSNWLRVAYVVAGVAVAIGGLVVLARPVVEPAAQAALGVTAPVATGVAKGVAKVSYTPKH